MPRDWEKANWGWRLEKAAHCGGAVARKTPKEMARKPTSIPHRALGQAVRVYRSVAQITIFVLV